MLKLGSFRVNGVVGVSPTSVGVKYRGGTPLACVVFMGSFRSFGSWRDRSGEGGVPRRWNRGVILMEARLRRAIVLWVAMVCKSPCFWCCLVLNYATHYTTKQVKSQVFILTG